MHLNPSAFASLNTFSLIDNNKKLISMAKLPVTAVFSAIESIKTRCSKESELEKAANAIVKAHFDSNSIFIDSRHQLIHNRIEQYQGEINVAQLTEEVKSHSHDSLVVQAMLRQFGHNFILFTRDFLNFYQSYFTDEEVDISIPKVEEVLNHIAEQIPQNIVVGKQWIRLEDLYIIQNKLVPALHNLKSITEQISQYRIDIPSSLCTQLTQSSEHLIYAVEKTAQLILDFMPSLPETELEEIQNIFQRWSSSTQEFHERFIPAPKIDSTSTSIETEKADSAQSTYKKLYQHYLTLCQENAFYKSDNKLVTAFNLGVIYHKLLKLQEAIREEQAKPDWKNNLDARHILELAHFVDSYIDRFNRAYNTSVEYDFFADQEKVKADLNAVKQIATANLALSRTYKAAYEGFSLTLTDDLLKEKLQALRIFHLARKEHEIVRFIENFQSAFEQSVLATYKKTEAKMHGSKSILEAENNLAAQITKQLGYYQKHIDSLNSQTKEDMAQKAEELESIRLLSEMIEQCWHKKTDLECKYVNMSHKLDYYNALFDLQTRLNDRIAELEGNPSLDLHETQNLAWLVSCVENYFAAINLFYKPILRRFEKITLHFDTMRFYYNQIMQNYDYHTYEAEFGHLAEIEQRLLKNIIEQPDDFPYKITPRAVQILAFQEQENNVELALEEYKKANAFLSASTLNFADVPEALVKVQAIEKSLQAAHSQIELIPEPYKALIATEREQFITYLEQKNISSNELEQIAFIQKTKTNSLFTKEEIKNTYSLLALRLDIMLNMLEKNEDLSSLPYFERYKHIFTTVDIKNDLRIPNKIKPLFLNLHSVFLNLLAQEECQNAIALQQRRTHQQ